MTAAVPRSRGGLAGPVALTAATGALYSVYALLQHARLHTSSFDSVIFDQAVHAYSRFSTPFVPVKGVHIGVGPRFDILGDHFSPVLAVLGPLYRLWPSVQLVLVAQALLFALSVLPVWVFTRRLLGTRAAHVVAVAYALSWGLQSALQYDAHEIMFAVPLTAFALERLQARRTGSAAAAALALLLVKEDMGLLVAAFGVLFAVRGARAAGAALVVAGLAAFAVTTRLLIPFFAGGHPYEYFAQSALPAGTGAALHYVAVHPGHVLRLLVVPPAKLRLLAWLLLPGLFCALVSPVALLAVPLLLERLLGTNPHWWGTAHHYSAVLMPVTFLAGADGAARLLARVGDDARRHRLLAGWCAGTAAVAAASCAVFPFGSLATPALWRTSALQRAAVRAAAAVPSGVTVEADSRLGPHLCDRTTVWLLDDTPRWAPWVLAETDRREWPFSSAVQARRRVAFLLAHGYRAVYDRSGFVVLHRT